MEEIMNSLTGGKRKSANYGNLHEIEKRQQELDEALYQLANKHVHTYADKSLAA